MKKGDFIVCAAVLLLAAGIFLSGLQRADADVLTAVVRQDGAEVARIVLTGLEKPVTVTVGGAFQNVIIADADGVRVDSATCPHQTCVQTGVLTRAGQTAVCLENKMILSLEGEEQLDAVVR